MAQIEYKIRLSWYVIQRGCDPTMIWITPCDCGYSFDTTTLQELDVYNTMKDVDGCILVRSQMEAFTIFTNSWDCGPSIRNDELLTCSW
jgi:hypothetical protein